MAAKWFFELLANIEAISSKPFDFLGENPLAGLNRKSTLVVGFTQTGTITGTIRSIKMAKEQGFTVLTITERRRIPVEELGDYYLNFLSGKEPCNVKTKGFSNSFVLLILLALVHRQ